MKPIRDEVSPKDLICSVCSKTGFKSSYLYDLHLYNHGAAPPRYFCEFCSKTYFRSDEYKRHKERHLHMQKLHYCDHCGRGFVDKRSLINHLKLHDDLPADSDTPKHVCVYCKIKYVEARQLYYHIQRTHLNPDHKVKLVNEKWVEPVKNTQNCVEITKVKNNAITIKKLDIKVRNPDIKSTSLGVFQQLKATLFAQRDNHFRVVKCDYCNKEMLKKSILNHIRERHLKLKKFSCNVCNKGFSRHYMLVDHKCGAKRRRKAAVKREY